MTSKGFNWDRKISLKEIAQFYEDRLRELDGKARSLEESLKKYEDSVKNIMDAIRALDIKSEAIYSDIMQKENNVSNIERSVRFLVDSDSALVFRVSQEMSKSGRHLFHSNFNPYLISRAGKSQPDSRQLALAEKVYSVVRSVADDPWDDQKKETLGEQTGESHNLTYLLDEYVVNYCLTRSISEGNLEEDMVGLRELFGYSLYLKWKGVELWRVAFGMLSIQVERATFEGAYGVPVWLFFGYINNLAGERFDPFRYRIHHNEVDFVPTGVMVMILREYYYSILVEASDLIMHQTCGKATERGRLPK